MVGDSWGGVVILTYLLLLSMGAGFDLLFSTDTFIVTCGVTVFCALAIWSMTRQWLPFVRLAERVFTAFGWPDPGNVDLVKTTKAQRQPGDSGELGVFYFRY